MQWNEFKKLSLADRQKLSKKDRVEMARAHKEFMLARAIERKPMHSAEYYDNVLKMIEESNINDTAIQVDVTKKQMMRNIVNAARNVDLNFTKMINTISDDYIECAKQGKAKADTKNMNTIIYNGGPGKGNVSIYGHKYDPFSPMFGDDLFYALEGIATNFCASYDFAKTHGLEYNWAKSNLWLGCFDGATSNIAGMWLMGEMEKFASKDINTLIQSVIKGEINANELPATNVNGYTFAKMAFIEPLNNAEDVIRRFGSSKLTIDGQRILDENGKASPGFVKLCYESGISWENPDNSTKSINEWVTNIVKEPLSQKTEKPQSELPKIQNVQTIEPIEPIEPSSSKKTIFDQKYNSVKDKENAFELALELYNKFAKGPLILNEGNIEWIRRAKGVGENKAKQQIPEDKTQKEVEPKTTETKPPLSRKPPISTKPVIQAVKVVEPPPPKQISENQPKQESNEPSFKSKLAAFQNLNKQPEVVQSKVKPVAKAKVEQDLKAKEAETKVKAEQEAKQKIEQERQAKEQQAKAEQAKAEQAKAEQAKAEQAKAEQAKEQQAKEQQPKVEQPKVEPKVEKAQVKATTADVNKGLVVMGLAQMSANLPLLYEKNKARKNFIGSLFSGHQSSNREIQIAFLQKAIYAAHKGLKDGQNPEAVFTTLEADIAKVTATLNNQSSTLDGKPMEHESRKLGESKLEGVIDNYSKEIQLMRKALGVPSLQEKENKNAPKPKK